LSGAKDEVVLTATAQNLRRFSPDPVIRVSSRPTRCITRSRQTELKTAKALGLTVPLPLTGLADEVIE
jgi:hypothetical protein